MGILLPLVEVRLPYFVFSLLFCVAQQRKNSASREESGVRVVKTDCFPEFRFPEW